MASTSAQATGLETTTTIDRPSRGYAAAGGLMVAGLLIVGVLGYVGMNGPGVLDTSPAFFVMGGSILILAAASAYVLFTLRATVRVVHDQIIPQLQSLRDVAQDERLHSLEGSRVFDGSQVTKQLDRVEARLATLERERRIPDDSPRDRPPKKGVSPWSGA